MLLSPETEAALDGRLAALERESTDQLVVVTVKDLQGREIEDYGYRLGRAWGIGQKEGDNGVLLIVAPTERKVRVEVGYGMEGILTDALSALIIQNEILPSFREGYFEQGILRGVTAIETQLRLDPAEAEARAARAVPPKPDIPVGPILLVGAILFLLLLSIVGSLARGKRHGRRGNDIAPVLIWAVADALLSSRGGGGGFGGGGGGFRGGGGGFGGGGASGGW